MAPLDLGPCAGEDSRLAAEQIDRVPALGGVCEEKLHEVGAVDAARDRMAERPCGPDDGHAVRGDESQSSIDSRSSLSVCMRTSLAALSEALRVGRRDATASSTSSSASPSVTGSSGAPISGCVAHGIRRRRPLGLEDLVGEPRGDALTGAPVPELRDLPRPPLTVQRGPCRRENRVAARAHDDVRSLLHRDRPLRRLPERHAGMPRTVVSSCTPTGVRQHERGPGEQAEEVEVSERRAAWIPGSSRTAQAEASIRDAVRGAGEDERGLPRDLGAASSSPVRMRSSSTFSGGAA
jgi:hypothetical protein